ncbi:ubiquitin hydrolase [Trypanosoma rangeli SC58]|uniref:Ubiquitin hydrolase n=1 Tax=Trypanosoma rangeli SC58 TaxID=429131 RepID=A0A061J419_TRYRA|nr:ubiquitin hydrolase [Trypanosoma rangeli SC58]
MSAPVFRYGGPSGAPPPRQGHCRVLPEPSLRSFANPAPTASASKKILPEYPGVYRTHPRPSQDETQLVGVSSTTTVLHTLHRQEDRRWNRPWSHSQRLPLLAPLGRQRQQPLFPPPIQQANNIFTRHALDGSELRTSIKTEQQPPVPLRNFGNTCYMNAIMQCILHSPWLLSLLAEVNAGPKQCPATSVLLELNASHVSSPGRLLLTIKDEAAKFNAEFKNNGQSDAHEFLRTLLFMVHSEVNTSGGCNAPYEEVKEIEHENEKEAMKRWREHFLRVDNSVIYDLFGGVMRSKSVCSSCGKESLTFDPFLDLSLPMTQGGTKTMTIESALKDNFNDAEEKLRGGNQLQCTRCRRARNGTRTLKIRQWPKILVLHLKRFDDTGKKNSGRVIFPESFMTHGSSPVQYQLYGVVCHSGSEHWGHYTSYVRTLSGHWYHCNDAIIASSTVMEAMQALTLAYVLFYAET